MLSIIIVRETRLSYTKHKGKLKMKTLDNLKINAINLYLTRRTDTRTQEDSKMYIANLVSDLETFDLLEVLNDNQALMEKHSAVFSDRSEEHTSELQSRQYLVCRLLLEKK